MQVSKYLYNYNFADILVKPLVAALVMALFILITGIAPEPIHLGLIITLIISSFIYGLMILILKTFDKEDAEIYRKIFKI